VTNAVKHFKWTARGKRPWLEAELAVVKPQVLVPMGATAAQALLGRQFRVTRDRGRPVESELAPVVIATIHPSAILRARDEDREREYRALVDDLRTVAARLS
jgi:DNA polymerase